MKRSKLCRGSISLPFIFSFVRDLHFVVPLVLAAAVVVVDSVAASSVKEALKNKFLCRNYFFLEHEMF